MDSSDFLVFATSIIGAGHIKTGKPCQDFSIAWQSEDKRSLAIIVCDGHGGDTYVRSDVGAKLAAEAALSTIKELIAGDPDWILGKKGAVTAREADESLRYNTAVPGNLANLPETDQLRYTQRCTFVRQVRDIGEQDAIFEKLFRTIYEKWFDAIEKDENEKPFDNAEKEALGTRKIVKAYGSTLMAYVQTPLYWFAFHIGDGRVLACNRKIEWKQLVPWDTNCFLNYTTSLCNTNPVPSFRYAFDATGNFPSAVFCCSDGIEDSWGDYEVAPKGLHDYYSKLIRVFHEDGKDSTMQKLEEFLPKLSEKGSKDDMSLAGYINLKAIANGIEIFRRKDEKLKRDNDLEKLQREINSKKVELKSLKELLRETKESIEAINGNIKELSDIILLEKEADKAQWTELKNNYESGSRQQGM